MSIFNLSCHGPLNCHINHWHKVNVIKGQTRHSCDYTEKSDFLRGMKRKKRRRNEKERKK
jgi:hypothetical protein